MGGMNLSFLTPCVALMMMISAPLRAQDAANEVETEADLLWKEVELAMHLITNPVDTPRSREEAVESYSSRLKDFDAALADFLKEAPEDSRRWRGRLWTARLAESRGLVGLPEGEPMMKILTEIMASDDAQETVRGEASAAALMETANEAKDTPEGREAWKARLAKHAETFPLEPLNEELIATERLMQPLELRFKDLNGEPFDIEKLRGKVVLLDFWATWCQPCLDELPKLRETYKELHPKGFEIVSISLDKHREEVEAVIKEHGIPWVQQFEGRKQDHRLAKRFGIAAVPEMWLLDKDGMVVDMHARHGLKTKVLHLLEDE